MQQVKSLTQEYSQAPWRNQVQLAVAFLLVLVIAWLIAAIYVDLTARSAEVGRKIQQMQVFTSNLTSMSNEESNQPTSIEQLKQINANLQSKLAYLTSETVMRRRAEDLGYSAVTSDQVIFVQVPGYEPQQTASLAPPSGSRPQRVVITRPVIRQTMLEWLDEQFTQAAKLLLEAQP